MNLRVIKSRQKYFKTLAAALSGTFAGVLESADMPAFFCLFSMIYVFAACDCDGRRRQIIRLLPFLAAYDFTKASFLMSIYGLFGTSRAVGALLALICAAAAAMLLLFTQIVCLSFFGTLRSAKPRDAVYVSLLFSASEWLCENLGALSFPWLGVWAQAEKALPLLMTAKLFGCRFTSFIIMLANGSLYIFAKSLYRGKFTRAAKTLAAFTAAALLTSLYGNGEISALKSACESSPTIRVTAAQLDLQGKEKSAVSALDASKRYVCLMESADDENADIVFLPETAVHTVYSADGEAFLGFSSYAAEHDCAVVTGCFYKKNDRRYNCVTVFTASEVYGGAYLKSHLVPLGEYLPFSKRSLAAGKGGEPIEVNGVKIACGICVESAFSDIFVTQVREGAQLIYIPTNDSWFGETFARHAHYLHAKMRAIENSRFTVRAGNCGISAVIAPWGEEIAIDTSKNAGTLTADVALLSQKSVYSTLGDVFALAPLSVILMSAIRGAKKRFGRIRKIKTLS